VGPGFHSLVGDMRELNQPASRRTFRWPVFRYVLTISRAHSCNHYTESSETKLLQAAADTLISFDLALQFSRTRFPVRSSVLRSGCGRLVIVADRVWL
jgi:hypothetical protein